MLKDLVGIAQKNVTLDTEFSIQDLVDLGMQFKDFDPDQLATYTPEADGKMVGAMSVLILELGRARSRSSTSSGGSRPSRPIRPRPTTTTAPPTSDVHRRLPDATTPSTLAPVDHHDAERFHPAGAPGASLRVKAAAGPPIDWQWNLEREQ